ncbi:MAG: adenylate kinase [Acidimicrobiales bacterium]
MVPGVRLVVLGKQGAGKGTQCVRLSHHYVVPHVSTGDMLRAAVKTGSELGMKVKEIMDSGELLGDDIIMEMVAERLAEPDARARGFILDGCPRTTHQAETLASLMRPSDIDLTIDIEVPTIQVMRRLAGRRVCIDCGANYSVSTPPRVNWTCDVCGGEVVQRKDDTEEAIRRRLELYDRQTAPLIDWYEARGQLARVNGVGSPDAVLRRIIRGVEERRGHWTNRR